MSINQTIAPIKPNKKLTKQVLSKQTPLKMSYEQFLQTVDEDSFAEWDASTQEVIFIMPPKDIHQATVGFLYELLSLYVRLFNLGKVRVAPFEVKLKPDGSAREPDILFVATKNLTRLTNNRMIGPPDLIIEIVSKESVSRDRNKKFNEYREAGVKEYWIIDPRLKQKRADFYALDYNKQYKLLATEDDEQVTSIVLPGFWLRPAWLWQADTLNPLVCSFEIEGVAEAITKQMKQVQAKNSDEKL